MKKYTFLCLTLLSLGACKNEKKATAQPDVVAAHIDSLVSPREDFFAYSEGTWLKNNPIPASESRWGIGNLVNEDIYQKKLTINEEAIKQNAAKGSNLQKIGDFWQTGMDSLAIEKAGYSALQTYLDAIEGMKNISELAAIVASQHSISVEALFSTYAAQDMKNSDEMALYLIQGGLGLPDRDYYFNTDAQTSKIRNAYAPRVETVLQTLGVPTAKENSVAVVKVETAMAKASRKLEDLRDPNKNYNKMTVAQLQKLTPSFNWATYFAATGKKIETVIVGQPEFFTNLEKQLRTVPLPTWKAYLKSRLFENFAFYLNSDAANAYFNFYGKAISGKKSLKPRWKRILDVEEELLGDGLGELFVKAYFPPKTKKRYEDMVDNVMAVFSERINTLAWMSAETKAKAQAKLAAVKKKVGYPDHFKDFSQMTISKEGYCQNIINAKKWWSNYNLSKLGKPVDRTEWDMTPQTYNAYYNPSNNEIVLPAAIFLIPGYKDEDVDDAVVYGYAGASTIGHEITHGFDDEGRQFDAKGNLVSWWTKTDEVEFTKRANVMVEQFNNYVVLDSIHLNGKASLGENIADYGGVILGYEAFKKTDTYKKGQKIAGLTQAQRYFLGYALGWQSHIRPEQLANQVLTDVHAPAKQRVIGPMANLETFYTAFGIQEGDKMWRPAEKRVAIW